MTHDDVIDTNTAGTPRVDPQRPAPVRRVPAEPGVWILLFGDMLVFSCLFAVYLHQRSHDPALFDRGQSELDRTTGAINTVVLLTSSLLVILATSAARRGDSHRSRRMLAGAAVVGSVFVLLKTREYHALLAAGFAPNTNSFFMYYFVLTGLHLAHVVFGLALITVLAATTRVRSSPTRIVFVEAGGCFWHMVDLLWLVIYPIVFLVK